MEPAFPRPAGLSCAALGRRGLCQGSCGRGHACRDFSVVTKDQNLTCSCGWSSDGVDQRGAVQCPRQQGRVATPIDRKARYEPPSPTGNRAPVASAPLTLNVAAGTRRLIDAQQRTHRPVGQLVGRHEIKQVDESERPAGRGDVEPAPMASLISGIALAMDSLRHVAARSDLVRLARPNGAVSKTSRLRDVARLRC